MSDTTFDILRPNLAALRGHHADLAEGLEQVEPVELRWDTARNGQATAALPAGPGGRETALCSKYDPGAEAEKLLAKLDFGKTACLVLLGLGLGYHAEAASEALGDQGILLIYEPDEALLRAVLEQRDLSRLLRKTNVLLLTGPEADRAVLLSRLERHTGLLTQGTQLVTLPLTRQRHAEAVNRFGQMMTDIVAYSRTNIATALVNASRTCRNLANNLDVYAAGATTDALHRAAEGYPAVCVGAGPSLVKNIDLLRDPAVRQNVVVIAVQTTLKPLLDRGVEPDFVTALDYSPICARFYEGLPELPGVTLVAEPKANAAILDAFPGPIRVTQNTFNDHLLGDPAGGGLARPIVPIKGGATVAHLSFYLAQHLGCGPVIFIGQDLGFSDGLYYAPGTAVHQVWDCELNPFNTIEMMEWQRVVRMRSHLQKFDDVHGRPIYSDEQMVTYLKQFERDFADAAAAGQTVIDATEGGMPKLHTTRMTFAEALARHATRPVPTLPTPPRELDAERLGRLDSLLARRLEQVRDLRKMSRDSLGIIDRMERSLEQRDDAKLNKLFTKLDRNRRRVEGDLKEPFALVNQLNAMGTFRRSRADRQIALKTADRFEKLHHQLVRDRDNIEWIVQACDEAIDIFRDAHTRATRPRKPEPERRDADSVPVVVASASSPPRRLETPAA
ncbi:MAG: 6-hydroxymethylpterin diphosphokinase MptE-like protein [Planctomycetota bacterium]